MPIYDNNGSANTEIGLIYDNNGSANTQIGTVYDNNGSTNSLIYSAETVLFGPGVTSGWTSVSGGYPDSVKGTISISGSSIDLKVYTWSSSWNSTALVYKSLNGITASSISITYTNSVNPFNASSTYIGIGTSKDFQWYVGNAGFVKSTGALGGAAHTNATWTATWSSPTNLSSYYIVAAVAIQGANTATLSLSSVIAK